jgi:hypothetical protein
MTRAITMIPVLEVYTSLIRKKHHKNELFFSSSPPPGGGFSGA